MRQGEFIELALAGKPKRGMRFEIGFNWQPERGPHKNFI